MYSKIKRSIWRVLVSVRLVLVLLSLLTAFSIVGTLVAQQGTTQTPLDKLYSPQTLRIFTALGFTDLFHSPIFIGLMLCLAMNLIACSIERLPRIWKQTFHTPPLPVQDPFLESLDQEQARAQKYLLVDFPQSKKLTAKEARLAAEMFFQKNFKNHQQLTLSKKDEDSFQLYIEKGKFSRLGVYITHLSLLLIMFGSVLGAIVGFEGGMTIEEGTRQSWMQHVKGSRAGMNLIREKGVPVSGFLNLGFDVECERFTLATYDGERPKDFRSKLNFYENDVKTASAEIAVNHPYTYKGITFYQASYSEVGVGGVDIKVYRDKGPRKGDVELVERIRIGDLYRVDGDAAFKITQIEKDLMQLGPAARVQYFATKETKRPEEFWVFQKLPGFDFAHRAKSDLHFVLDRTQPKYATGISMASDPGVWIVWIGSAILIAALFIALYTFHSRYWITYNHKRGLVLVGWSNKLFLFEPRFEKLAKQLEGELAKL